MKPEISIILPVFNEAGNLRSLHESLRNTLEAVKRPYEIIYCDDGSTDGSIEVLRELSSSDPQVKVILLRRNFGQTAAIVAGVDHSQGDILVLLDADWQNDPADIPQLLAKLDEGYDIVSGWRRRRQDPFFSKVLPSKIANNLISWVTGVHLHDHGCTLKAYRREVWQGVSLYGEMHRYIPIYAHWMGAKVGEIAVAHHPRKSGISKYSLTRTFKVLLDLPVLVLLGNYLTRPIHFFGTAGLLSIFIGLICAGQVLYKKWEDPLEKAHRNPFLLLAVFFALVGVQIIMVGLLGEILTRVYHESRQKKIYAIREIVQAKRDP